MRCSPDIIFLSRIVLLAQVSAAVPTTSLVFSIHSDGDWALLFLWSLEEEEEEEEEEEAETVAQSLLLLFQFWALAPASMVTLITAI